MKEPTGPVDIYFNTRPLLRHVRIMNRVMDWVDNDPRAREFYVDLYSLYSEILQEEFAPDALMLALAVAELEDAFPAIAALKEG